MKARILIKNFSGKGSINTLLKNLSTISDLTDIKFIAEESMIAFKYYSEDAVFNLLRKLNDQGCPGHKPANLQD